MSRERVLLSEASSLTAREFVTVLGRQGFAVELATAAALPLARFSRWARAVHKVPAPADDPAGYLRAIDALMATGRFDAVLPTHEQAWLFAVGSELLPHATPSVAAEDAFERVMSKLTFARTLDTLGLPQPAWHTVEIEEDLDALGFPVWVKAAFSTAGRGVHLALDHAEAVEAWRRFVAQNAATVMLQTPVRGTYAQVQGVFDHGRMVAAASSEQLAPGAGGSAAARISAEHPLAIDALDRLGQHLSWHGGIGLDYFHDDGKPQFIECNPRITEPGNAAAAGVDFPRLMIALAKDTDSLPSQPLVAAAGFRTRSTMAIALGAAERSKTRRAVLSATAAALLGLGDLKHTREVLTPILADPPSVFPFIASTASLLATPANAARLARRAVDEYAIPPAIIDRLRKDLTSCAR